MRQNAVRANYDVCAFVSMCPYVHLFLLANAICMNVCTNAINLIVEHPHQHKYIMPTDIRLPGGACIYAYIYTCNDTYRCTRSDMLHSIGIIIDTNTSTSMQTQLCTSILTSVFEARGGRDLLVVAPVLLPLVLMHAETGVLWRRTYMHTCIWDECVSECPHVCIIAARADVYIHLVTHAPPP
jgi:hypothetical protein